MIAFDVQDMTCGHCVGTITQALERADPGARVTIDLVTHRVQVALVSASAGALALAIREAGYSPVPVDAVADEAAAPPQRSCCGHCH